ncbi:trigger factor [Sulfitobacter pseudonitzschiae]|uniref:Trigger factor n=1 Tax=Pseudosulfitobacter pseudonitzschiae TaxID=1402135 RepID=A0A9Q2P4E2_9RHOB|nr:MULTISPECIES: trigger factor [Roseobacteraceae]MBM2292898.1 trigger factor [Pseudosulfitobacter pseudonitzschiae]MBM2298574.1 trigger factor [Pseudosulfitobacter pseudonitzschiae]MBM2303488.1 trigger factor [Pseudosulfitobacter pseudonitzschiae]MBM2313271.1 trigger factor [Pseudosulfitobacter pseudonitzschiae]MBM2318184.1 trigger factor [Pseudosulfitobacter pseudonitzschiae]|tara:strand:+ start:2771 stop:4102 length:1332 start_codon:yes stop_codon:yes gene_type:complete
MQVTETLNEGLKRGYAITITAAEIEAKVNEKLAEAQPEVEMKGFRKGKVPMALLKKQFGPRIMGEVMQESVDGAMSKHFEDSGDRPAMQPDVKMTNENWKEGDDVNVEMSYEKLPEIPEVDLSKIELEKLVVKSDDAAVEEALGNLAETAQDFKDRKKGSKAKDGDQIVMDFVGKVDGEAFEGGSAEDYPLVLGSNSFIPGFEDQLVGVKEGEEKAVTVSFPEDYQAEHLAGKEAVFDCTIKAVKEPKAAEINDELAKKFGAEDLAALKGQIAERLEAEYAGAARAVMKRGLLDALDKAVSFELPPSLVDAEAGQIAHQLWHEENPDVQGHDHPDVTPTDEHKTLAERRVRLGLLLAELGQKAEVEVTDAEMSQAVMNQARQYPGQERQFFEFVQQNPQMQQQLRAPLFEDKVVDYVFDNAAVTEKEISKDDLQKAVEALEDE